MIAFEPGPLTFARIKVRASRPRITAQSYYSILKYPSKYLILNKPHGRTFMVFFFKYVYSHHLKQDPNSILEECNTQTLSASLWFLIGFFIIVIIIIGFFWKGLGGSFIFSFEIKK